MKSLLKKCAFAALSILAVMLLAVCVPHKAKANDYYSYEIIELKQNTWVSFKNFGNGFKENDYYGKYNAYKITIPANRYIKLDISSSNTSTSVYVKSTLKNNIHPSNDYYTVFRTEENEGQSFYSVLPKGVLYLTSSDSDFKIRWKCVKASNPTNYCRAKARKLARGKKETIVFNDGYEYSRWYKVTLKKKKTLTINLKCLDGYDNNFIVYNSVGDEINCPPLVDYKTYRTTILPKGTYYIRIGIGSSWDGSPWISDSRIKEFSWK